MCEDLYNDAVRLVLTDGKATHQALQRRFNIAGWQATILLDAMGSRGVIGPYGDDGYPILQTLEEWSRACA